MEEAISHFRTTIEPELHSLALLCAELNIGFQASATFGPDAEGHSPTFYIYTQVTGAFPPIVGSAEFMPAVIDPQWIDGFAKWNFATFGPGLRTEGTIDHIREELVEIEAAPTDPEEWVDVLMLSLNGLTRLGLSGSEIIDAINAKFQKNLARNWPDWRIAPRDKAIKHQRADDEAQR
ncbi:DUF550 domain-containing protein [Brucella anthropi]|uniref:DUF550 domain-containing protein n=1 Tax=Brucella anthropi TaxID=529 RepID=UPI001F2B7CFE|nr:DUF550 domain-containing protein [Brucella anthropi]